MATTNRIEKEIDNKFKELLLEMNEEEFREYFKKLINNYYDVLFTYQEDYSKYYEESNKQYDTTIKVVKDLLQFDYNNLDNFENVERLKQAEHIAFNQMNTIHFLEWNYSDLIYYNTTQELLYINATLSSLIKLYNDNPSEALLDIIEDNFTSTVDIIKQAKKLPVYDKNKINFENTVVFKKEHFKEKKAPSEAVEFSIFSVPTMSLYLPECLEEFDNILEDLKAILPEVVDTYLADLTSSEMLKHYYFLKSLGYEEEKAKELTAISAALKEKNNTGTFLYEILDSWS